MTHKTLFLMINNNNNNLMNWCLCINMF